ncbi:MAG: hypothetical protein ACRELF_20420 [Gemmataceae bacterium]
MHGDNARATNYDDPMCARLLGTAADVPAEAAARIAGSPLLNGELAGDVLGQLTRITSD